MIFDDICDCVIVPTSRHEEQTLLRYEERGFVKDAKALRRSMFLDGRDLIPDADCDKCAGTGFKGRIGIFEVVQIDNQIKDAIVSMSPAREIKNIAIKNGMQTMLENGFSKAFKGLTTIEEVLRIIHE